MIAYTISAAGNVAAGKANGVHERRSEDRLPLYDVPTYRAQVGGGGEQYLVHHLVTMLDSCFPRTLLVNYYVTLKTYPFVLLSGLDDAVQVDLATAFAAALVGQESGQFITISSDRWARRSSQSRYYQAIHERFGVSQYVEALHEAAAPDNDGKVYLLLLKGLTAEELDRYFNRLIRIGPHGERYLALPGTPEREQPLLPSTCLVMATLHTPGSAVSLNQQVLQHTGPVFVSGPLRKAPALSKLPPPPVGLQRILLRALCHDPQRARARLSAIPGVPRRLGPSPEVARFLLEAGVGIPRDLHAAALRYVANSFDEEGRGLFDPADPYRNAQIACDLYTVQRCLWNRELQPPAIRQRLTEMALCER